MILEKVFILFFLVWVALSNKKTRDSRYHRYQHSNNNQSRRTWQRSSNVHMFRNNFLFQDELIQGSGQNMYILRNNTRHLFRYHNIPYDVVGKCFDDIIKLPDQDVISIPCAEPFEVTNENTVLYDIEYYELASLMDDDEPLKIAKRSWEINHVYPVSYALAKNNFVPLEVITKHTLAELSKIKTREWAYIIPGEKSTYIYETESAYKNGYRESWKAHTKVKAGEDCYRHLEIIANGAIPIFQNIRYTKAGTLFAYPKRLLAYFEDNKHEKNETILAQWRYDILKWGYRHLTAIEMIKYMFKVTGLIDEFEKKAGSKKVNLFFLFQFYF